MSHYPDSPKERPSNEQGDIEAFADRFDRQWMDASAQEQGAFSLDPALWTRIRRGATPARPRRARRVKRRTPAGIAAHSRRRMDGQENASGTQLPIPQPTPAVVRRVHWIGTVFAFLAVALLVAGVWFSPIGPGSLFEEDEPIRYAAQIPAASPSPLSSPASTPEDLSSYLPLDIPGVTCDVKPLAEDEVMNIVRNPENRALQLANPNVPTSDRLVDQAAQGDLWEFSQIAQSPDGRQPSPEEYAPAREAADQFWSCLRVGTAYQVWNLIDPAIVQREVFWPLPVFRDEESVGSYISRFGPLRYSASVAPRFPDLDGGEGPYAERRANPDPGSAILVQGEYGPTFMYVNMVLDADPDQSYMIVFRDFGDGVWRAIGMYFPQ